MSKFFLLFIAVLFFARAAFAQTNFVVLAGDGAWTWYNDPRALFHNGVLYFGYVRGTDGHSALSAFHPQTGATTELWTSALVQKDDHNNPGLLVKQDGTLLAIHARHGTDQFFSYHLSNSTNPVSPTNWSAEMTIAGTGAGVTYANPYQLTAEPTRIYDYMRDLNFNPTVIISTNGGVTWSTPQLFIQNGGGSIRPYVKYASDYANRIDFLYTDGHPRDITNSLYHLYYQNGAYYKTDGTLVKNFSNLPIQHASGERGSVIYQYSDAPTNDPNVHIPTGRAWCWET
ncbi:MAG: BNR-4 repeat-containing protein, partial [Verrucomicrobiota bacterium]